MDFSLSDDQLALRKAAAEVCHVWMVAQCAEEALRETRLPAMISGEMLGSDAARAAGARYSRPSDT